MPKVIRVAALTPQDLAEVPIIVAIRLMVERAQVNGSLMLTNGGALSRADVKALFNATEWPDFDKATVLAVNKVLNEDDVVPILFTRMVARNAGLLRAYKGRLLATKRATELLLPDRSPDLFRATFEAAFWRTSLADFDRMPCGHWPQTHIGVVLWCFSVAAYDWSTPEDLAASCTMPVGRLTAAGPDFRGFAMVTRVLRPLVWLGLMDLRVTDARLTPVWRRDRRYRKSTLFDRALSFAVAITKPDLPVQ